MVFLLSFFTHLLVGGVIIIVIHREKRAVFLDKRIPSEVQQDLLTGAIVIFAGLTYYPTNSLTSCGVIPCSPNFSTVSPSMK
jgi:hypothetical protein